ncbi:hypothetical protein V8C42DRAFT_39308 [Trichoderma barbatum]
MCVNVGRWSYQSNPSKTPAADDGHVLTLPMAPFHHIHSVVCICIRACRLVMPVSSRIQFLIRPHRWGRALTLTGLLAGTYMCWVTGRPFFSFFFFFFLHVGHGRIRQNVASPPLPLSWHRALVPAKGGDRRIEEKKKGKKKETQKKKHALSFSANVSRRSFSNSGSTAQGTYPVLFQTNLRLTRNITSPPSFQSLTHSSALPSIRYDNKE